MGVAEVLTLDFVVGVVASSEADVAISEADVVTSELEVLIVVEAEEVAGVDLGNKEGARSFSSLFSLKSHLRRSVFLENVPATLDTRVSDKSQDALIDRMKKLTVKPTDLPPRPDFGTTGPSFKLRTNFFPVKLPKKTIYEYDIAITPSTTIKRVKRRIFELAEATNDWTQHGLKGNVAHDFASKLVAVNKLPDPLVIKIIFKDDDDAVKDQDKKKQKPKEYTLTFKFVKDLDTSSLLECVHPPFLLT